MSWDKPVAAALRLINNHAKLCFMGAPVCAVCEWAAAWRAGRATDLQVSKARVLGATPTPALGKNAVFAISGVGVPRFFNLKISSAQMTRCARY